MSSMSLTNNPIADLMHMRWGVQSVKAAQATVAAEQIRGTGSLLSHFGVSTQALERLGMSPVNAKALLGANGWRATVDVSKQLSSSLTGGRTATTLLESVKNGWGSFETQMPALAKGAKGAAAFCKSAAAGTVGRCGGILKAAKAGGFFGKIMGAVSGVASSVGRIAGPMLGPLAKFAAPVMSALKGVGNFMRMIPGLNLIFAAADTFKALKVMFDPTKSMGEKLAAVGKAALSIGAALPIPGASLLGGVRGAWAVGEGAASLMKHSPVA